MIKEKYVYLFPALLAVIIGLHCRTVRITNMNKDDMVLDQLWQEIDSLEKERLPRSAAQKVIDLKASAHSQQLWADYVKAVIYLNKLKREPNNWQLGDVIADIEEEANLVPQPARSIIYSYLGQLYSQYLAENYWRIKDRKEGEGKDVVDLSITQLQARANEYYLKSISSDILREAHVKDFQSLVEMDSVFTNVWTSMFDILAYRALQHFSSPDFTRQPVYTNYPIDQDVYLATCEEFAKFALPNPTKDNASYETLRLFQKLVTTYKARPALLLEYDLMRLQFVFQRSTIPNKNLLYVNRLNELINSNKEISEVTLAYRALADYYMQVSVEDDSLSWARAYETCRAAQDLFPTSRGAKKCLQTINQLETKSLRVVQEQVSLPDHSMLVQIDYRNVDKLFGKVVKLTEDERAEFQQISYDKQIEFLNKRAAVQQNTYHLSLPTDYREHSTEVILNPLPVGYYVHLIHLHHKRMGFDWQLIPAISPSVSPSHSQVFIDYCSLIK